MERVPNWSHELVTWARRQADRDLEWGETDCTALAAGAVETMCGQPPPELPTWTTKTGALRVARRVGGTSGWLKASDAFRRVDAAFAQRGDIFVEPHEDDWDAVGVLVSYDTMLTADPQRGGPLIVPRSEFADDAHVYRVEG